MTTRWILSASIALACAGCVQFKPEPLDPAARASALTSRRLAAKTWTLRALTTEALKNSAEVAVARAQYETARAAIGTAGERPNPTVALSPQIVTPHTTWIAGTYGVDFDWTIETAGKRGRRMDAAGHAANAAAANLAGAEWKARAAVRKALLELWAAERKVALLNETNATQAEALKMISDRIKAGSASALEAAQPRLLAAQLRLQLSEAEKSVALARAALAEALTMSSSGLDGAKFAFDQFSNVPPISGSHRRAALTRRADVLASLADYAAAEAALRLEIAKQYPDIHLNPGYQLDAGENKWALGVGLTLPILSQNRGPIREAEAKRREAAAKFDAVQAKALAECDRASAGVSASRAKLATTDALLAEQDRQIESLQRIVGAGEGDKLALVSAEVERATVRIARMDALAELHAAVGDLEQATQNPTSK